MTTTATNRLNRILQAAREYRTYVRAQAKASGSTCPITVVDGAAAPHTTGSTWYYTTPGGKPVRYPNAYRRAWGKPVYNASTYAVVVGRGWLAQHLIPEWCMAAAEDVEDLIRLGAFAVTGESAAAIGASHARILETMPVVGGWVPAACQVAA